MGTCEQITSILKGNECKLGFEKTIPDFNSIITQFLKAMHESERTQALEL